MPAVGLEFLVLPPNVFSHELPTSYVPSRWDAAWRNIAAAPPGDKLLLLLLLLLLLGFRCCRNGTHPLSQAREPTIDHLHHCSWLV